MREGVPEVRAALDAWLDDLTLLDVVFGALNALIGLLPDNTLSLDGLNEGAQYLGWVGLFIDVPAFAAVVSIIASVEAGLLAIRAALFIWRLTPLSG